MSAVEGCRGVEHEPEIDLLADWELAQPFQWQSPTESPLRHELDHLTEVRVEVSYRAEGFRYLESLRCQQSSCQQECVSRHESLATIRVHTADGLLDEEFDQWAGLTDRGVRLLAIELEAQDEFQGDVGAEEIGTSAPWQVESYALQVEARTGQPAVGRLLARLVDSDGLLGMTSVGIFLQQ